jgi:hypothetical protein
MREGHQPEGTLVTPGRSTRVRFKTEGEYIFKLMVCFEIPLFRLREEGEGQIEEVQGV